MRGRARIADDHERKLIEDGARHSQQMALVWAAAPGSKKAAAAVGSTAPTAAHAAAGEAPLPETPA